MGAMPRKLPIHLHRQISRHGRPVWYFRRGKGPRVRIPGDFGSPEFEAAYQAALAGAAPTKRPKGPVDGSFSWGLALYRKSQAWAVLSLATQRQRTNIFKGIEVGLGSSKLTAWRRADIAAGRDKRADRPAAARHFVEALRGLFKWLVEAAIVAIDPTEGVKVVKPKSGGFAVWTDDDVAAFRVRWPLGTRERVAFDVLRETGLRRGDAVRVGRPHVREGVIRIDTEKTGERVAIAITHVLREALAAGPCGELTFIAGERGFPMKKESFGNWFREAANSAGVAKSAHGLRKAAATADALDGYSDAELDAKFGWTGRRMASLYTRAASRERLSLSAADRIKKATPSPSPSGEGEGSKAESAKKSIADN